MKYGVLLKNKQVEDIVLSNLIACVFRVVEGIQLGPKCCASSVVQHDFLKRQSIIYVFIFLLQGIQTAICQPG